MRADIPIESRFAGQWTRLDRSARILVRSHKDLVVLGLEGDIEVDFDQHMLLVAHLGRTRIADREIVITSVCQVGHELVADVLVTTGTLNQPLLQYPRYPYSAVVIPRMPLNVRGFDGNVRHVLSPLYNPYTE